MRRIGATLGGLAALAAVLIVPLGGGGRPLPLHAPLAATATLTGIVHDGGGVRLVRVDPASLRVTRRSALVPFYDGWVRSPGGKLLAVSTYPNETRPISTLRFANPATLRWVRRGVRLDGSFRAGIWPSAGTLLALVDVVTDRCCAPRAVLETVDTVAKKVVARRTIEGRVSAVARSADGLVLLLAPSDGIGPARLVAVPAKPVSIVATKPPLNVSRTESTVRLSVAL